MTVFFIPKVKSHWTNFVEIMWILNSPIQDKNQLIQGQFPSFP
jgi:hypothetical protein